jgi:hypothetical protein
MWIDRAFGNVGGNTHVSNLGSKYFATKSLFSTVVFITRHKVTETKVGNFLKWVTLTFYLVPGKEI